jgi:hypothetical protein
METTKWWHKGIRFSCQGDGLCCKSRGEYNYVYLNADDRKRLAKHINITVTQLCKKYLSRHHGFYYIKDPNKDCIFIKDNKCSIYEARPIQCSTWPFWHENLNPKIWHKDVKNACPGIGKGKLHTKEEIEKVLKTST